MRLLFLAAVRSTSVLQLSAGPYRKMRRPWKELSEVGEHLLGVGRRRCSFRLRIRRLAKAQGFKGGQAEHLDQGGAKRTNQRDRDFEARRPVREQCGDGHQE